MKRIVTVILYLCLLSHLFVFADTNKVYLKEFQYSIIDPMSTYNELVEKYGKPDFKEVIDVDETIFPNINIADGSKLYKYFFRNIGEFGFFFRGYDGFVRLHYWTLKENYINTLLIPKTRIELERLFGEANEYKNKYGEDILWYWQDYWNIYFTFKGEQLIEIECICDVI